MIFLIYILAYISYSNEYISKQIEEQANKNFIKLYDIKKDVKTKDIYVYTLKNKDSKEVLEALTGLTSLKLNGIENKIIISGSNSEIEEIKHIIEKIDTKKKQILIKLNIIDTNKNLFDRLGIKWKLKGNNIPKMAKDFLDNKLSFTDMLLNGGEIFDIDVDALKEKGDLIIKTVPSILVVDGEKAYFKLSNETVNERNNKNNDIIIREAGIILEFNPKIKKDNNIEYIEIKTKIELSNFKNNNSKNQNIIESVINLKNKQSMFIATLNNNNKNYIKSNTPILSDIPIIGSLFTHTTKNNNKREIYVEIEARII